MTSPNLTKLRFSNGVWEGLVEVQPPDGPPPEILVTLETRPVAGATLAALEEPGRWHLRVPVPADAIGDGVQTFVITDAQSDRTLGSFALLAGEALGDDIRAEVSLLREELDMLKRAFRRHCLETGA